MIKYIFIVYSIIIMCFSCCLASEFREAEWGMSREQVKQLEKTEPVFPGDDTLTFKGKVASSVVHVIYEFENDKLKSGTYRFVENRVNVNVYIQDYLRINEFLDSKYGKPESREEIWSNDMYKDKKGFYGLALSTGQLKFVSSWNEEKTVIVHVLYGYNYLINHSIVYHDKLYKEKTVEKREREEMKGL